MNRNSAIRQMGRIRSAGYSRVSGYSHIGADAMPTTGTLMDVARARLLGIAALNTFLGIENHKKWLLWGVHKDGSYFSYASDNERDMNDAFGYIGMDMKDIPESVTAKYGPIYDMMYAAYWDSADPKKVAKDEYLGELTVHGDAPAPTPAPVTTKPKSESHLGLILGILGGGVGLLMLTKKKG